MLKKMKKELNSFVQRAPFTYSAASKLLASSSVSKVKLTLLAEAAVKGPSFSGNCDARAREAAKRSANGKGNMYIYIYSKKISR